MFGANGIAYIHSNTKLSRAFSRNPNLITSSFKILKEDTIKIEEHSFPVVIAEVNNIKMLKAFEGIARGLYLHEFSERFIGKCIIIPIFVKYRERNPKRELLDGLMKIVLEQEQSSWALKGSNPQIFTYRIGPIDQFGFRPMIMTFYKTLNVFVSYVPKGHTFPFGSNS